jgi:OOP family OmpA-OmpF porin
MKQNHLPASYLGCVLALVWPLLAAAQTLTQPAQRITDTAIHADYKTFEQTQARIKGLNDQGRPVRDYHLSKAQCWLDVSFHEYTRNDRSAFPQESLDQSVKLVQLMEQKTSPLPMDTPLVNHADRLRPDLWAEAASLKSHAGFQCVAQRVACAEVELVHAGNEHKQQGWRHAKPYVQLAEDQLTLARVQADACVPKPPPPPVQAPSPVPPPPPAPAPPVPVVRAAQPQEFQANVLFNHDRHEQSQARAMTLERLDVAIARSREAGTRVTAVQLVGHADRTGQQAYNDALANRRVQMVREYLIARGVPAAVITSTVQGDRQQVNPCSGKFKSRAEELECLLPNRRVEVNFVTLRQP